FLPGEGLGDRFLRRGVTVCRRTVEFVLGLANESLPFQLFKLSKDLGVERSEPVPAVTKRRHRSAEIPPCFVIGHVEKPHDLSAPHSGQSLDEATDQLSNSAGHGAGPSREKTHYR